MKFKNFKIINRYQSHSLIQKWEENSMKKILLGCLLVVSSTAFAATDVMVTLEQLEQNFQQLEA